jgi:nucleoid-associated protein YgaU
MNAGFRFRSLERRLQYRPDARRARSFRRRVMGIFDFVKKAGAKVFGGKDPDDSENTYKPLRKHVEEHGIDAKDIHFRVSGSSVVVEGYVPDQDTREKVVLIVGNVEGVDKVDDRLNVGRAPAVAAGVPASGPPAGGPSSTVAHKSGNGGGGEWTTTTYTVNSGDTLSAIAKAHYGKSNAYMKIFEANKPMLKDPDKIYPGQVLRIPKE